MKHITLWDLPTRLAHWLLAACVGGAIASGLIGGGLMDWHGRLGFAIAGLLAFRLVWGLAGATHARFSSFVRGPGAVRDYLRGAWRGVGHNPLGAFSVLAMLGVLALQVGSGLLANDDIAYAGPYNLLVTKGTERLAVAIHKTNFWLIAALVALHLGAIVYYRLAKRENLVGPMINGRKAVPAATPDPAPARKTAMIAALAVAALAGWLAAGGATAQRAPPPPPAQAPAW